jgi:DNA-binding HxlR family transcriptional regulator
MKKEFRSGCPVSSSLDVVGDKWTLLIIRDMLVKHKKTFKQMSDSYEKIAPSILSARLKLLESYKLIFKTKAPENKKENIYLLTEKGIRLTPIIIEFSLWGNYNMREFNEIDDIEGLNLDKTLIIQKIQDSYNSMLLNFLLNDIILFQYYFEMV